VHKVIVNAPETSLLVVLGCELGWFRSWVQISSVMSLVGSVSWRGGLGWVWLLKENGLIDNSVVTLWSSMLLLDWCSLRGVLNTTRARFTRFRHTMEPHNSSRDDFFSRTRPKPQVPSPRLAFLGNSNCGYYQKLNNSSVTLLTSAKLYLLRKVPRITHFTSSSDHEYEIMS